MSASECQMSADLEASYLGRISWPQDLANTLCQNIQADALFQSGKR